VGYEGTLQSLGQDASPAGSREIRQAERSGAASPELPARLAMTDSEMDVAETATYT